MQFVLCTLRVNCNLARRCPCIRPITLERRRALYWQSFNTTLRYNHITLACVVEIAWSKKTTSRSPWSWGGRCVGWILLSCKVNMWQNCVTLLLTKPTDARSCIGPISLELRQALSCSTFSNPLTKSGSVVKVWQSANIASTAYSENWAFWVVCVIQSRWIATCLCQIRAASPHMKFSQFSQGHGLFVMCNACSNIHLCTTSCEASDCTCAKCRF